MAESKSEKVVISEALKKEFSTETARMKTYTLTFEGGLVFNSSDLMQSGISLTESLSSASNIDLSSVEKPEIQFTLLNFDNTKSDLLGKTVEIKITANGEDMPMGSYIVTKAEKENDDLYNITARGFLIKFDKNVSEWWNAKVNFPITHRELIVSLCDYVGINYQLPETYTNSTMVISDKTAFIDNVTGSTFLGYLQEVAGCFFTTSKLLDNGKTLTIKKAPSIEDVEEEEYDGHRFIGKVEFSDFKTEKVERLQIRHTSNDMGVIVGESNGKNTFIVEGNILLFGKDPVELEIIANGIYQNVKNIQYTPFTGEVLGLPYIEPGSIIKFLTPNGSVIKTIMMMRKISGTQGFTDHLSAKGTQKREYVEKQKRTIQSLKQKTLETQKQVDKFSQKMTEIETSIGETNERVSQIDQKSDELSTTVKSTEKRLDKKIGEFETHLSQTDKIVELTVKKSEVPEIEEKIKYGFKLDGLHVKKNENSKKEAILTDDELRFTRADGTDAVRINEHESYFGKWVTIASHRLEVFPIHEWDPESVGGINRDSQTISGTGLFYSGDSEGV